MKTASTPSKKEVATEGQASKLIAQLAPGIKEAILDSQIPRDQFQGMLEQEKDLRVRSRFRDLLKEIAQEVVEWETFDCDYDEPDAILKAIEANKPSCRYIYFKPEDIPLEHSGKISHRIAEFCFEDMLGTEEILLRVYQRNCKLADPLTTLLYTAQFTTNKFHEPLVTFFEVDGHSCYLWVQDDMTSQRLWRRLCFREDDKKGCWHGGHRFLIVHN